MNNKFKINFNFTDCTHMYFKDSSCNKCVEICPIENVITKDDFKINFNPENCIKCGACVGICPTEAFKFNNFSLENFVEKFINNDDNILSCKKDIPCLSFLHPEILITLALNREENIILDIGFCGECFIKDLLNIIKENVQEANYFLNKLKVEKEIKMEEICLKQDDKDTNTKDRRSFLKNLGKLSAGLFFWSITPNIVKEEEVEKKDTKNIVEEKLNIERRNLLLKTLKDKIDLEKLKEIDVDIDRVSFTSDKWIENKKCTNCSVCYSICPTGALKGIDNKIKISFEPSLCIKCRICHEVCPENCLHLEEKLNLNDFITGRKILIEHIMIQCSECLIPFSYKGDTTVCPRCRELEDEIKELLKLE